MNRIIRPDVVNGETIKIRSPNIDAAIYVTINDARVDDKIRPIEVFLNSRDMPSWQWISWGMRQLSRVLQAPGPFPAYAIEDMLQIADPQGFYVVGKVKHPSVVAHIGYVLREHCRELGLMD